MTVMIRSKRCFDSFCILAICALGHSFVSTACQSTQKVPSEDALSHSVRSGFKSFAQLKMITLTGTAVSGTKSGHFTVQVDGDKATLTLPDSFPLQKEVTWNRHGSLSCELYRSERLVSKSTSGLCGFPAPWFYPFAVLAQLNSRAYQSTAVRNGDQILVTVTPAGIAPISAGELTGRLTSDLTSGTISELKYSFRPASLDRMATATALYSNVQAYQGVPFPRAISMSVDDSDPMILTVESIEMGGR
jgi:hypothetical protein